MSVIRRSRFANRRSSRPMLKLSFEVEFRDTTGQSPEMRTESPRISTRTGFRSFYRKGALQKRVLTIFGIQLRSSPYKMACKNWSDVPGLDGLWGGRALDGRKLAFQNGHARVETRVLRTLAFQGLPWALVDSVSARFKNAHVENAFQHSYRVKCEKPSACRGAF